LNSSISSSEPDTHAEEGARRFLFHSAWFFSGCFALVWLWIWTMPLAFLDPEYPSWRAKQILLSDCDLGQVLILGDSRAATGMMPSAWPIRATNLAVGGGEAIEAFAVLKRMERCAIAPRRVIISMDVEHFTHPDLFWERTVRFGFLDADDITDLRRISSELGDTSVYEMRHTDGLPSLLRDAMYRARFPSLYFASLVKGGLFLRWFSNQRTLNDSLSARGQYFFGTAPGSSAIAAEGHLRGFHPLPILNWYFDQILKTLERRGVPVTYVAMPFNDATAKVVDPDLEPGFRAWLALYEARYPGFQVIGHVMPHWPDRYFGDGFAHLNPDGAARFSAGLGLCLTEERLSTDCVQRLQEAPPSTQNDAQYGWFNETAPDASANVWPSSKRGS
jgi:hypothetical protein